MLLGIDIGGTKTAICAGSRDGAIARAVRMSSDTGGDLEAYFAALLTHCRQILAAHAAEAVGISAPGPLDARRGILIAPPNNPGWRDVPIVARLESGLGLPVYLNNDANACALAEQFFGAYRGTRNLIYLTTSTGMGGGIIVNGRLLQGATDTGGEVGHQVLDPQGPRCSCGLRGCWEVYVGGRSVAAALREKIRARQITTSIVTEAGGDLEKIDHRALAAAARAGDAFALAEWEGFIARLAQGIGNLIQVFNPDVILLGTMAIHEGEFLLAPLRERLADFSWEWPRRHCTVAASSLGVHIGELAGLAVARAGLERASAADD